MAQLSLQSNKKVKHSQKRTKTSLPSQALRQLLKDIRFTACLAVQRLLNGPQIVKHTALIVVWSINKGSDWVISVSTTVFLTVNLP